MAGGLLWPVEDSLLQRSVSFSLPSIFTALNKSRGAHYGSFLFPSLKVFKVELDAL